MKESIGRYRTDQLVNDQAGRILKAVGLSRSAAIDLFFRQVILHNGLPFEVKVPSKTTAKAIAELQAGGGERFATVDDLMRDLESQPPA